MKIAIMDNTLYEVVKRLLQVYASSIERGITRLAEQYAKEKAAPETEDKQEAARRAKDDIVLYKIELDRVRNTIKKFEDSVV